MDRILLFLDHKENRRLLESWLRRNYQIVPADTTHLPDEPFDLGILDGPALDRLVEQVQGRREAEGPLFLPFLLITARRDVKMVTRHLWRTVDELILSPIEKVELQARVEMLLRARRLSLESERRYHALSETSLAGVVIVGKEGRILYANDTFSKICGYTRKELLSLSPQAVQAMVHPDDQARVWGPFQGHLDGKAISPRYEYRGIRKDGTECWLEMHVGRIDYRGQPALQGIVVDITERVQAQEALRESRERLNHLFTVNPAIVYELDPEKLSPTWVSSNITELTGYTPEKARQPGWWAGHVHPKDREETKKAQERSRVEDRVAHEYRFEKKNGAYIWVRDELRLLRDEQGRPKEIVGSWMNITGRKEAEIELAKSEQRYRGVFENTGTAMIIVNEDGAIAFANGQCAATTGYSPEELQGTDWRGYVFSDDLPMMEDYFRLRFSDPDKAPKRYEVRLIHADGSIRNALVTVGTIPAARQVVVSMMDITKHKEAEEALSVSEEKFRKAFATSPDCININRLEDGMYISINEGFTKITGYSESDVIGKTSLEINIWVNPGDREKLVEGLLKHGQVQNFEAQFRMKDGKVVYGLMSAALITLDGVTHIISITRDITERKQAEEDRRVLETAINNAQECIMISDRENRLTYVNRAFEKLAGYSAAEVLGKTPGILKSGWHDREFYQDLKSTIYSGRPWQGNMILKRKNGELYEVAASITPILNASGQADNFVSVHRDITKEREIERRIQQNQRLEAIGTLAGGIAHDFNNILTPIMGYTEMCMYHLPSGSKIRENLEEVNRAAARATDLVKQILSFSRRSNQERKPVRIALITKEALKLLRSTIPTSIEIRQEISATEESVIADPTEIHQVIMNLCINASHAMPDGGLMSVGLHAVDLDREASKMIPGCTPGRYLKLSVEDTGHGIAPEILDKIFEPYFTTKKEGLGTGLGLATTHSVVTTCGGGITVYSEPGKGTRFNLYFPVAVRPATKEAEKTAVIRGGRERVLIVDDDISVLNLHRKALENYGYSVTAETDPEKALAIYKKSPADFDMVLTDMTMPGMTGDLLAAALLQIRPDLPVVVLTGFSERMNEDKARRLGIRRLLTKPVSVNDLLSTIRDIFDAK